MDKLLRPTNTGGYNFWCPGCECAHYLRPNAWTISGTEDKPTLQPSVFLGIDNTILHPNDKGLHSDYKDPVQCHLYITDGKIIYLNDCTHKLKGKTIDMIKF